MESRCYWIIRDTKVTIFFHVLSNQCFLFLISFITIDVLWIIDLDLTDLFKLTRRMPITKTNLVKAIRDYILQMGADETKQVQTVIIKVSSNSINILVIIYTY